MKRLTLAVALTWLTATAWAQRTTPSDGNYRNIFDSPYNRYVTFNMAARYGLVMPLGGQKTYIDAISPTNLALEGEWLFPQRFSLGIKTGYQYSQQRLGRQVISFSDGNNGQDISAVQTRTLTIIPTMASLSYYFAENAAALRPYVQMAGGAAYVNYSNFFGSLVDQQTGFRGAIAPAVGVKYYGKREQGFGAEVQAQYQHVFFNHDRLPNSAPSLMLSAGIVYRFY